MNTKTKTIELSFDQVLMDGFDEMIFIIRVEENSIFSYEFINQVAMEKTGLSKANFR
ncbi:hypothetical protein [Bacillus dakarensis]|uniref:hypothetical protein n=1 Tax=Robertmurraya dakarensis TaxID=1926278 RepID=UPI0012B6893D|nr:hypothetical protein [Bacillus dakarensis]